MRFLAWVAPSSGAGVNDILGEDHLFGTDEVGVVGRLQIARKEPHPILGVVDNFGLGAAKQHYRRAGGEVADVDRAVGHFAAANSAGAFLRQAISSSQLSAS